jgi:hypothetical protein
MENGIRQLKELRLWEFSIVTFPMNTDAGITSVKNLSGDELNTHLEGIRRAEKGIQVHTKSLRMHLKAVLGDPDDLDDEDDTDEPLFEDDDDDKAFLAELKQLAEQAQDLASA